MTATENLLNTTEWSGLLGVILDGGYELREQLAAGAASAQFKARILGTGGQEATVSFYHADLAQAEEQLSFWQTLREWPHPNLNTPLAAGYRWLGDAGAVYVVLPIPDEKLSAVLIERPLAAEEATEVVQSVVSALGHLHACGLAHGSLSPDTVLAVGYSVLISSENVRRQGGDLLIAHPQSRYLAPECGQANNTAAADLWCLGATLFEVLSQRRYTSASDEQLRTLPYSLLLHECLKSIPELRCTLAEALEIIKRGPAAAIPAPPVVVAAVAHPPIEAPVPIEAQSASAPEPTPVTGPISPAAAPVVETRTEPPKRTETAKPMEVPRAAATPVVEAKPAAANQTGAAARVAAAEEARQAASEAFKKKSSGASSIKSAPVPAESRHKPIAAKRKPVAAKIKQIEASPDYVSAELQEYNGDQAARDKSKPRAWQLSVVAASVIAMISAVVFLVVVPRLQSPMEPAGPVQAPPPSAAKAGAWQTKTLAPPPELANVADARTQPAKGEGETPAEIAGGQADNGTKNWRVVLYAYEHQQEADRRLQLLAKNHPTLDAHVFTPASGGPYLVVMGGALSRDAALEAKRKAIQQGLPRAIHVQSF